MAESRWREFLERIDGGAISSQADATLSQTRGFACSRGERRPSRLANGTSWSPSNTGTNVSGSRTTGAELADRLAAEAGRRGVSLSDLLIEYADDGLRAQ
ncbi:MAG TPA: hypothetical protein VLW50_12230 [Streptosporangiaceae bacterium]|nr:hypothetical protein [Streptosporangiaceae bacterium]